MTAPTMTPTPLVPEQSTLRKWAPVIAIGVAMALLVLHPWSRSSGAQKVVQVAAPTTVAPPSSSTTAAGVDPLSSYGRLNPTADALVGQSYDARRELAHRISEAVQASPTPVDACSVFVGSTSDGTWQVSLQWGPSYPVPVLLGCPWPADKGGK